MYLAAAVLLVGALAPVFTGVSAFAQAEDVVSVADGVAQALNSMRPGISTTLVYASLGDKVSVLLAGNSIVASAGGQNATRYCVWRLPALELLPGTVYRIRLDGSGVVVG